MDFVIGDIDNILKTNKTELNDEVINTFGNINSKSELRRSMAQMTYFIMNDKEIKPETKIKLITQLQGIYNKAKEELIQKKMVVEDEDEDEKVKTQQVELNKRIVLAKHPNRNGNLLKSININVNSSKYPISARDQVDFFLLDIAEEFDMLMNPDKADDMLEDKLSRVIETTDKFIPNDFSKGKNTDNTDDDKNKAAPKGSDVKSFQDEVEKIEKENNLQTEMENAYYRNPLTSFSMFGWNKDKFPVDDEVIEAYNNLKNIINKKKADGAAVQYETGSTVSLGGKKRKTRKNRKNTGGSKLSLSQQRELRDTLKTRRKETPYPRPRATERTWNEFGSKLLDKYLLFNDAKDSRAYDTLKKIENFPTKVKDIKNRTLTQQEQYDRLGGKKRKTRKNRKNAAGGGNTFSLDPLDHLRDYYYTRNMSKKEAEAFRRLRAEFLRAPSLTARKVKESERIFGDTKIYRPEELQHRTLPTSDVVQEAKENPSAVTYSKLQDPKESNKLSSKEKGFFDNLNYDEQDYLNERLRRNAIKEANLEKGRIAVAEAAAARALAAEKSLYRGGKKRKTKKNKKKNQKRKTSKRKQKQK
jgi:hypothetical protein